jgi:NAD(P)H-hydrate epimerase
METQPQTVRFVTSAGVEVPAVTAEEMREVDRIAVEHYHLDILQMMENAGRSLAENVIDILSQPMTEGDGAASAVTVLAGSRGNGGGGLCCARHLHNRGFPVSVVLDRPTAQVSGAAARQLHILQRTDVEAIEPARAEQVLADAALVVDALIGYGLHGAPQGRTAELIEMCNASRAYVLSLDVPSGLHATTGERPGPVVRPDRVLTLAAPKTGLAALTDQASLFLTDIGIPPELYTRLGMQMPAVYGRRYWLLLRTKRV